MGEYVQLGAVRTWYAEHGAGPPLVLLHGGLVDARFFGPNLGPLAERFRDGWMLVPRTGWAMTIRVWPMGPVVGSGPRRRRSRFRRTASCT